MRNRWITRFLSVIHFSLIPTNQVYIKAVYGNYVGKKAYTDTTTLDGGKFSGVPWNSGLIEGKGRFKDEKTGKAFIGFFGKALSGPKKSYIFTLVKLKSDNRNNKFLKRYYAKYSAG